MKIYHAQLFHHWAMPAATWPCIDIVIISSRKVELCHECVPQRELKTEAISYYIMFGSELWNNFWYTVFESTVDSKQNQKIIVKTVNKSFKILTLLN